MRLTERVWPEVGEGGTRPVLCVPVGSCEQHGPHLPLATDTLIAEALASAVAARVAGIVIAPAITISASGEHAGFPGTLSIGTAVMTDVVVELGRSADWAAGIVFVNGHGGNREALEAAATTLAAEGRAVLSWWPALDGGDAHAGRTETSILLALRPDLVRLEHAVPGATAPLAELAAQLRAGGVHSVSPNGVLGDPSGASVAEGTALLADLVERLATAIRSWRAGLDDGSGEPVTL